jgi:hypothetical protein
MPIDDPHTWAQGATAFKSMFEGFRAALGLLKDVRGLGTEKPDQAKAITAALEKAEEAAKVAEAEIAKALGYELCKCQFPPVAMLTVGYLDIGFARYQEGDPVYECPRCGYCTAGPYDFQRIAPKRDAHAT